MKSMKTSIISQCQVISSGRWIRIWKILISFIGFLVCGAASQADDILVFTLSGGTNGQLAMNVNATIPGGGIDYDSTNVLINTPVTFQTVTLPANVTSYQVFVENVATSAISYTISLTRNGVPVTDPNLSGTAPASSGYVVKYTYAYTPTPPSITSITGGINNTTQVNPAEGYTLPNGTKVTTPNSVLTVTGVSLGSVTAVTLNGAALGGWSVNGGTTAPHSVLTVPIAGQSTYTTGFLQVTTRFGITNGIMVYPQPLIYASTPATAIPGMIITLSGYDLKDTTAVSFTGIPGYGWINASTFTYSGVSGIDTLNVTVPINAGTGPILVTNKGGVYKSSWNFNLWYDQISVSPAYATVAAPNGQQYTATAYLNHTVVSPQPSSFIWSVAGNGGNTPSSTITSTGYLQPGTVSETFYVNATTAGITGSTLAIVKVPNAIQLTSSNPNHVTVPGGSVSVYATILANGSVISDTGSMILWTLSPAGQGAQITVGSNNEIELFTAPPSSASSGSLTGGTFQVVATLASNTAISNSITIYVVSPNEFPAFSLGDPAPGAAPANSAVQAGADPIIYATGEIDYYVDDLESTGFSPWKLRRSYANRRPFGNSLLGPSWVVNSLPGLVVAGGYATVVLGGNSSITYTMSGSNPVIYTAQRFNNETLAQIAPPGGNMGDEIVFTDTKGNRTRFYGFTSNVTNGLQGQVKGFIDAGANVTSVNYDNYQRLSTMTRNSIGPAGPVIETINFYNFAWSNVFPSWETNLLSNVSRSVSVNGVVTTSRAVNYFYYDGSTAMGLAGQLMSATIQDGQGSQLEVYGYRYWGKEGLATSIGLLKYVFGPRSFARMTAAGVNMATASDSAVAPYADKYFVYGDQQRVTQQTIQGSGIDQTGTQNYSYAIKSGYTSANDGYNSWMTKTIETMPDGCQHVIYSNYAGQTMLSATIEPSASGGRQWVDAYQYDGMGRQIWHAAPTAMTAMPAVASTTWTSGAETSATLGLGALTYVNASAGLIETTSYYTSTTATSTAPGGISGYFFKSFVQQGVNGTPQPLHAIAYLLHSSTN